MSNHDPIKAQAERRFVLTEESGEVIQALQKINRFTENSFGYDNVGDLEREIGQTLAILSLMVHCGDVDLDKINEAKLEKICEYKTENRLWQQEHSTLQSLNGLEVLFQGEVSKEIEKRGIANDHDQEESKPSSPYRVLLTYSAPGAAFVIRNKRDMSFLSNNSVFARVIYTEKEDQFLIGFIWLGKLPGNLGKMPEMEMFPIHRLDFENLVKLQELIDIPNARVSAYGNLDFSQLRQIEDKLRLALLVEITRQRYPS